MDNVVLFEAVNTTKGIFRYIQTISRLFAIRSTKKPDYYILGFRGYEIFWIVRILTIGKPLILDHMMSPYDSLISEKKLFKKGRFIERLIYYYEKSILKYSDIVLTDTVIHRKFFSNLFKKEEKKIYAVHVGTDEDLFKMIPSGNEVQKKDLLNVLFYGSFLPLHGINIILTVAYLLQDKPICFTIIGGDGKALRNFNAMKKRLGLNNIIHKKWVPFEQLPDVIHQADVCLGGPFGNTGQACRVVTGKTFQSLAMGKTVIVGKIEHDYGFIDKDNCLLVSQGNERDLAGAILWCFENQDKLPVIGNKGLDLYRKIFSIACIEGILSALFRKYDLSDEYETTGEK
ncbi:MAG TPA: glycosyltransferase [Syntrophales bacterium]|nr:glycosyltransferase [Syntrophales bacterium]